MLGSNTRAKHVGEVKRLRKTRPNAAANICLVCKKDKKECPVIQGINSQNIDRIYDIIFSRMDPQINILVDTSKKPFWAKNFLGMRDYELKFIHLIRDPRAYVRRMVLRYKYLSRRLKVRVQMLRDLPGLARNFMFRHQDMVYTYRWLKQNQDISDFLAENRLQATTITYHDLAKYTAQEVQRVTEAIGLVYEPTQLEYWNFEHHGTQKTEYEWVKARKVKYFDVRWKDFLSPGSIQEIRANKHVNAYLRRCNIRFTEEGLTRLANL
jgi:hypothetical protein